MWWTVKQHHVVAGAPRIQRGAEDRAIFEIERAPIVGFNTRAQLGVIRTSRVDVQGGGRIAGHPLERHRGPRGVRGPQDRVPVDERLHRQA